MAVLDALTAGQVDAEPTPHLLVRRDGDYFFCAASGTDMAPIFKTALSQASSGIKLIRLP